MINNFLGAFFGGITGFFIVYGYSSVKLWRKDRESKRRIAELTRKFFEYTEPAQQPEQPRTPGTN